MSSWVLWERHSTADPRDREMTTICFPSPKSLGHRTQNFEISIQCYYHHLFVLKDQFMSHLFQLLKSQRVGQAQGRRTQMGTLPEGRGRCGDGWWQTRTAIRAGCKLSIPKSCDIDPNGVWPWSARNRVLQIASSTFEAMAPGAQDACWTFPPTPLQEGVPSQSCWCLPRLSAVSDMLALL